MRRLIICSVLGFLAATAWAAKSDTDSASAPIPWSTEPQTLPGIPLALPAATNRATPSTTAPARQATSPTRQTSTPQAPASSRPAAATRSAPATRTAASPRTAAASNAASNAAAASTNAVAVATNLPPPPSNIINVEADDLSFDMERNLVIARGNIHVTKGLDYMTGDYAEVDTESETVYARGNLVLQYQGMLWKGEETTFNFRTGVGDFGSFELYRDPFYIVAEDSERVDERHISLSGVMLTTCDPAHPEYSVRASWAAIEDDATIRAKHVRFQFGPVPFFYFPYIKANIHWFDNFEFTPGYRSKMGVFLLTAYRHRINATWMTRTHLDLRAKRGVAVGEDIIWEDPDGRFNGILRGYYLHDNKPWRNDKEKAEREELIDADRYWFRFNDRHNITDRDYLTTELNYVSDPWILHDFFDDVYQKNVQPENRVTLSHRGQSYVLGAQAVFRLNDFYSNVSRLPEIFWKVNRQQIFDTPFYYQGDNTMSFLRKEYPDGSTRDDYDAYRVDTYHMVYLPTRHFGFLSVIPRGGYRGTYYSKTRVATVVTNVVPVTNEMGVVTGTTNKTQTLLSDGDAVWRSLPEIGLETSFSAFGLLHEGPTGIEEDVDLRHVFEPYANYTLRFEPDTHPDELWQFDSVDALDKLHTVLVGMRNYLQTKRGGGIHNLVYADLYSTLNVEPDRDEGEETLENIGLKVELKPFTPFHWDFQTVYDVQESEISTFDTQVGIRAADIFEIDADYRYKVDTRNVGALDLSLFPEQRWEGRFYVRMDLDESELEEHSYYIIHRTDCLGLGLGVRIRPDRTDEGEDDYTVWLRIWPLAFPDFYSDP